MKPAMQRAVGAFAGAAAAALMVFLGAEAWLRLSIPSSSSETIYQYTLETRRYKVMKPNFTVTAWGKELRTNDLGFRDKARSIPPKEPGEVRIIVLGSSFTVSAGVDYDDIYTSRLQQQLRQVYPKTRVINLAVGGYNPIQYALVLQEVGLALQPDMVLVALFPDSDFRVDIYDENRRVAMGKSQPKGPDSWIEEAYTYRAYGQRIADKISGYLRKPAQPADPTQGQRGWDDNVAALKWIAYTTRQRSIPLTMAIIPHTFNFVKQRDTIGRIEKMCKEQDFNCLNLLEGFIARQIPEPKLRLNALDSHPNETYNAIAADLLFSHFAPLIGSPKDGGLPLRDRSSPSKDPGPGLIRIHSR